MIDDDTVAKSVLLELGLINKFLNGDLLTKRVDALAFDGIPTHHLVALRFHGFEEKKDNGYAVKLLPKSGFSDPRANHTLIGNMKEEYEKAGIPVIILK